MPNLVELLGYAGMALTILAYAMKNTVELRLVGIASSVAFLTYGWLIASYPVMIMEAILLPLNLYRLVEMTLSGSGSSTHSQSDLYSSHLDSAGFSGCNTFEDAVNPAGRKCDEFAGRSTGIEEEMANTKTGIDPYGIQLADLETIRRLDPNLASRLTQFLVSNPLIKIESDTLLQDAVQAA
jgi:hypothetical protein